MKEPIFFRATPPECGRSMAGAVELVLLPVVSLAEPQAGSARAAAASAVAKVESLPMRLTLPAVAIDYAASGFVALP